MPSAWHRSAARASSAPACVPSLPIAVNVAGSPASGSPGAGLFHLRPSIDSPERFLLQCKGSKPSADWGDNHSAWAKNRGQQSADNAQVKHTNLRARTSAPTLAMRILTPAILRADE